MADAGERGARQEAVNADFWAGQDHVTAYRSREVTPAEGVMLVRYRERFDGRVVELGCGAGRLLGYLTEFDGETHAIDISPHMVEYCRATYPAADVRVGDLLDLDRSLDGRFDVVLAAGNLIDVLGDERRRAVLRQIATSVLAPGGLLIFSTHNLDAVRGAESGDGVGDPAKGMSDRVKGIVAELGAHTLAAYARYVRGFPRRVRNRRRLRAAVREHGDYAILNDDTFDYGLLHYYIGRDAQERQLTEVGLALVECVDGIGAVVPVGARSNASSLWYVATQGSAGVNAAATKVE